FHLRFVDVQHGTLPLRVRVRPAGREIAGAIDPDCSHYESEARFPIPDLLHFRRNDRAPIHAAKSWELADIDPDHNRDLNASAGGPHTARLRGAAQSHSFHCWTHEGW